MRLPTLKSALPTWSNHKSWNHKWASSAAPATRTQASAPVKKSSAPQATSKIPQPIKQPKPSPNLWRATSISHDPRTCSSPSRTQRILTITRWTWTRQTCSCSTSTSRRSTTTWRSWRRKWWSSRSEVNKLPCLWQWQHRESTRVWENDMKR